MNVSSQMSQQQSHRRFRSSGTVPFSWENSPGISKVAPHRAEESPEPAHVVKLPPPPGPEDSPRRFSGRHSIHVPLPPCPFQPSSYGHAGRGLGRDDDPFLAAYMECTKSRSSSVMFNKKEEKISSSSSSRTGSGGWGLLGRLSCKQGSGVREDGIRVKVSNVNDRISDGGDHRRRGWLLESSQSQRNTTK